METMKNLSVAFGLTDIDMQNFMHRMVIISYILYKAVLTI